MAKKKAAKASKPTLLDQIEELGALQFGEAEIETILQIERIEDGEQWEAYERGLLKAEAEVRKTILNQARQGSAPAQRQFTQIIEARRKNARRG